MPHREAATHRVTSSAASSYLGEETAPEVLYGRLRRQQDLAQPLGGGHGWLGAQAEPELLQDKHMQWMGEDIARRRTWAQSCSCSQHWAGNQLPGVASRDAPYLKNAEGPQ